MPEQQLLRTPAAARQTRPPCCLARAHNARATRRPHDGTARCRRHHAMPPTSEPPPRCSLPAARRPTSLSLPCDDFHTALATLAHRRRLPHAVAQHDAFPPSPSPHHAAALSPAKPALLLPFQRHRRLSYKLAAVPVDAQRPRPQSPELKAPPAELAFAAYKRHPRAAPHAITELAKPRRSSSSTFQPPPAIAAASNTGHRGVPLPATPQLRPR